MGLQEGYSMDTIGIQEGYSGGTGEYSRGTVLGGVVGRGGGGGGEEKEG